MELSAPLFVKVESAFLLLHLGSELFCDGAHICSRFHMEFCQRIRMCRIKFSNPAAD